MTTTESPSVAIKRILKKCKEQGIEPIHLASLPAYQQLEYNSKSHLPQSLANDKLSSVIKAGIGLCNKVLGIIGHLHGYIGVRSVFLSTLLVLLLVIGIHFLIGPITLYSILEFVFPDMDIARDPCFYSISDTAMQFARPPINCAICEGLTEVDRVSKLSTLQFEELYAYTGVPVVVTDATKNWTALESFSFNFFKELYSEESKSLGALEEGCQFFPYKTDFRSLQEVFNMPKERADLSDGSEPWYIGWSNCDPSAAQELRKYYKRPYFLPEVSGSSITDWLFIGSPGYGAHMHIDNVHLPSWQAQVTGTKLWTLEPPPECYHVCKMRIEVRVNPGDIIVLDTNRWYHSTLILGNEIGISIGSEYD